MSTLLQEVRYSLRMLLRSPGLTAVAIITLGLGIGANTAVVAVVKGVLFRQLPYPHADRIVIVWAKNLNTGWTEMQASAHQFQEWQRRARSFDDIAAYTWTDYKLFNLSGQGSAERVSGVAVSANILSTLELKPLLGRAFIADENRLGSDHEVLLSYELWKKSFGGEDQVVGRSVNINREPYTVVGVLPENFELPALEKAAKILIPLPLDDKEVSNPESRILLAAARLKPGVTPGAAEAEMAAIVRQMASENPKIDGDWSAHIVPASEEGTRDVKQHIPLFFGIVGFVLLIACANVATVLIARFARRRSEVVVRVALGASRFRLVRQLLFETLLLAIAGGALGLLVARWGMDVILAYKPMYMPSTEGVRLDWTMFLLAGALSTLAAMAAGLLPALLSTRANLGETMNRLTTRMQGGKAQGRLRNALVVMEVAMSLVLLIGAALMVTTLVRINREDLGFDPRGLVSARITLDKARYTTPEQQAAFYRTLVEKVRGEPGVQAATAISHLDFGNGWSMVNYYRIEGQPEPDPKDRPTMGVKAVTPDYFETVKTPLLRGRSFREHENEPVVIINDTLARKYFGNTDPIGKRLYFLQPPQKFDEEVAPGPRTIIGVVPEVRRIAPWLRPWPGAYVLLSQDPVPSMYVVVRASNNAAGFAAIRHALASLDNALPTYWANPMSELISEFYAPQRFEVLMLVVFAGMALMILAMGLYAVISYAVALRTAELGIRMALGAAPRQVLWLMMRSGLALLGIGALIGVVGGLAATRVLATLVYGVSIHSPVIYALALLVVAAIALAASFLPARRAAALDPLVALRYE